MTQKQQAMEIIDEKLKVVELARLISGVDLAALDTLVGVAQNAPPEGESDGSIDEALWYELRDLVNVLMTTRRQLALFRQFRQARGLTALQALPSP